MPSPDASVRTPPSRDPSAPRTSPIPFTWWPLLAGACLIAAGLVVWHDPALNEAGFHAVNDLGPAAPALWSALSVAGLALSAWIYLAAFAQARPERVARLLWICVVGGIIINQVKHRLPSPRPLLALGPEHVHVIGEGLRIGSMPSGHSAMAFAVLTLMLAEWREHPAADGRRFASVAAVAGWALLACGIALSRLAVSAHWPGDALFGSGLGLLFAGLAPHAWPVGAMTRGVASRTGQRLVALGLLVSALCIAATPAVFAAAGLSGSRVEKTLSTGYPLAEPLQWLLAVLALAGAWRWWRAASAPRAET
jgi:membrane-associated phospholipid phosphatase